MFDIKIQEIKSQQHKAKRANADIAFSPTLKDQEK